MPTCKILKSGLWTSIQDLGRTGYAYYAIPPSGVMDSEAASLALSLVNLDLDMPLIECTMTAPSILFNDDTTIALTGANMKWCINNSEVPLYKPLHIKSGDILSGKIGQENLRSYIAIKGQIKSEKHFDSCSSYKAAQLGFNHGLPLQKNQIIEWTNVDTESLNIELEPQAKQSNEIILHQGPEYNLLSEVSKQLLTNQKFHISSQSNRMGARLKGGKLQVTSKLKDSVPVLPGFVQLPPSGEPIVILQDGQTTGGYPRIAYMKQEQLNQFNQIPFNREFKFILNSQL